MLLAPVGTMTLSSAFPLEIPMAHRLSAALGLTLALAGAPHTLAAVDVPLDHFPGQLAAGGTTLPGGEFAAVYPIQANAGEVIQADLVAVRFNPYLLVRSPDGTVIEEVGVVSDDQFRSTLDVVAPTTGVYEIYVTSQNSGAVGEYLFAHRLLPNAMASSLIEGRLTKLDPIGPDNHVSHTHQVPVTAGLQYTIDHRSDDYDSYLTVVLPDGTRLEDDDSAGSLDSRVVATPTVGGNAQVIVRPLGRQSRGSYALEVSALPPLPPAPLTQLGAMQVSGQLQVTGPASFTANVAGLPSGARHVYTFNLTSPSTVTFLNNSTDFDGHIYLLNAQNALLGDNDDHNGTRYSRLETALNPGTYHLVVAVHNGGTEGSYHLTAIGVDSLSPGTAPAAAGATGTGSGLGIRKQ